MTFMLSTSTKRTSLVSNSEFQGLKAAFRKTLTAPSEVYVFVFVSL